LFDGFVVVAGSRSRTVEIHVPSKGVRRTP
jgi:hypothetical protein